MIEDQNKQKENQSINPTPLSVFFEQYKRQSGIVIGSTKTKSITTGEPIFTKEDIFKVTHRMASFLRYFFVMHNVTWQEINEKTKVYGTVLEYNSRDIGILKGNVKKAILKPTLTFQSLQQILSILGYIITDIQLDLIDQNTGQSYRHKLSEAEEFFPENK